METLDPRMLKKITSKGDSPVHVEVSFSDLLEMRL